MIQKDFISQTILSCHRLHSHLLAVRWKSISVTFIPEEKGWEATQKCRPDEFQLLSRLSPRSGDAMHGVAGAVLLSHRIPAGES